ncbi:biotin--[acetyl-CoA-carboxylase] ligase [Flammeovirga kamogawensis]|uniref:Biotin--[acetyl-CoA-carboxylase] ligase n=1 Tax=Flammeovirga kamogawensis TaxID=373891 RepID=A0ABX8GSW7_9BACT|nr:biotin--[acetyl-CoA-carboxylase] ligase [Flammeovirga kamogawensis]MBB6462989.1 BirA family biotin operon repressor/biotin-[acetyl-CoA-carboxylase] ligase [Flammeovirga kamogawensis]QWG06514.1 biotin--[acetyl-CoA-carboxylase] ligase [Flammeovirga kamogawensis]TRX68342.1 biotin--[acetyl-CoA-carboxylase] ligase [Flammeovirga kamogawensis]
MNNISANTSFIGKSVIYMPSCHSTNDALNKYASKKLAEGTVLVTTEQTKGRGQRGNTWECEQNANITLSVFLRPSFLEARHQFHLNVAISLAVYDTISSIVPRGTKIKWPNDILINQKKVCGILIENFIIGKNIDHTIVGIGLNINQKAFKGNFPATSLFMELNKKFQIRIVTESLLEHIEDRYLQLKNKGYAALRKEYYTHLFWYQEIGSFEEYKKDGTSIQFQGQILGVDENGCLSIAKDDKKIKNYAFKEVKHLY